MTRKRQRGISMTEKLTQGATSQPQLHPSPSPIGNTIGGPSRSIPERLTQGATSQPQLHPTPPSTGGPSRSIPERFIQGVISHPQLHSTPSTGGLSRSIPERLIRGVTSQPQLHPTPPSTENMVPSQTNSSDSRVVASNPQSHPSVPSTDTSSHTAASVNTTGESNNIKKGRGAARHHSSWGSGQRLEVEMNQFMQPVEPNASKLLSQLGCIVRDGERAPLTYAKWIDMPNHVLEDIWRDVKDNTNVPDGYKDCCLRKMGSLWRGWKARLKEKYYYENMKNPEKLLEVPDKVSSDQWPTLVRFWNTEEAELYAQKNKANRSLQGLMHRTGRKSFANLRMEMANKGEHTDRASVFIKSRRNKKGETSKETALVLSQLEERLSQVAESEQSSEQREKIFTDIVGGDDRHGQVRTYGFGPSRTDVFGRQAARTGPSDEDLANLRQQIREEVREEMESRIQEQVNALHVRIMAEVTARFNPPSVVAAPTPSNGQVSDGGGRHRTNVEANEVHDPSDM